MHSPISILVFAALCSRVSAHGLITEIQGANGVNMPGLTVVDGTPRDCSSSSCGSQDDTAIIRDDELGSSDASALGRTDASGPVDAATNIAAFMDDGGSSGNASTKRGFLDSILGGLSDTDDGDSSSSSTDTTSSDGAENRVAASAGKGASSGLPTASDTGEITMTYRQINQDGAGPLQADIDPTSGGTDPSAFEPAELTQDADSGLGDTGLSLDTNTDFPITVQMPEGMVCEGEVAGVQNVCVVRVRNPALAGPFGGSAAFTQSEGSAARRRALHYGRMRGRRGFGEWEK
ncbi:hypothetical protein FQN54_009078 [Arachnomyces sp. PD_36]|nr:hypothetical protein FQN54_009078 [Arachnomyces sp. PD_36]